MNKYTIMISEPENKNQIWGAWCEELKLSAFGETESESFYNLIENIPEYFKVKDEDKRLKLLRSVREGSRQRKITIPAFA
jgi:hypothetical protein